MINITTLEQTVLEQIRKESEHEPDSRIELLSDALGMTKGSLKGVVGSLQKKKLVRTDVYDNGYEKPASVIYALAIDESGSLQDVSFACDMDEEPVWPEVNAG